MDRDEDLSAFLPRPPMPAPARREAAIAAAMRRFDGVDEETSPAAARTGRDTPPWWSRINLPAAGTLAAASLVALIALPLAWNTLPEAPPEKPATQAEPPQAMADAAPALADEASPEAAEAVTRPAVAADPAPAPAAEPDAAAQAPVPARPLAKAGRSAPAAAEAKPLTGETMPAAAAGEADRAAIVVTGSRIARSELTAPSPVTVIADGAAAAAARGDWNACTPDDPARSLAACRSRVDPAAKGRHGRASAHLADGLARAWRGEHRAAIAAFDRAIAIERSSLAYLNRGLAWRSRGDLDRALADLDRAIRHDPGGARGYYHRSRLYRQRGELTRARADEQRAVQLDPGYAALVGEGR